MSKKRIYSEEVESILGNIPPGITRWGTTFILVVLSIMIISGYFLSYSNTAQIEFTLKDTSLISYIIPEYSGKLHKLYILNGDEVFVHDTLAIIETWEQKYAITSPGKGYIFWMYPISENDYLYNDRQIFRIQTEKEHTLRGEAFIPVSQIGYFKTGQNIDAFFSEYSNSGLVKGIISSISFFPVDGNYIVEILFPDGFITDKRIKIELTSHMKGVLFYDKGQIRLLERLF